MIRMVSFNKVRPLSFNRLGPRRHPEGLPQFVFRTLAVTCCLCSHACSKHLFFDLGWSWKLPDSTQTSQNNWFRLSESRNSIKNNICLKNHEFNRNSLSIVWALNFLRKGHFYDAKTGSKHAQENNGRRNMVQVASIRDFPRLSTTSSPVESQLSTSQLYPGSLYPGLRANHGL